MADGLNSDFLSNEYKIASEQLNKSFQEKQRSYTTGQSGNPEKGKEEREKQKKEDSQNRRILREIKRSAATGRMSSWLKRYSDKKGAEFDAQNKTLQQTRQDASISYSEQTPSGQGLSRGNAGNQISPTVSPNVEFDVCENGVPAKYKFLAVKVIET